MCCIYIHNIYINLISTFKFFFHLYTKLMNERLAFKYLTTKLNTSKQIHFLWFFQFFLSALVFLAQFHSNKVLNFQVNVFYHFHYYTKLYSFKLSCSIVSLTAANTNRIFSVSVAHVK